MSFCVALVVTAIDDISRNLAGARKSSILGTGEMVISFIGCFEGMLKHLSITITAQAISWR
jgi:hypothetical protein